MGSAWLQTKHVHAGRPGVPAPVMIKRNRNPIFHHLWRSEQYSAFAVSQSKSDFHYQHIIRVPARLFALKSCSCCCCPLPFKLRLFRDPFLQSVLLWKLQSSLENGRCVSQDIMLPNYHFSRVLFCQNIMLPKHCDAKCSKLSFAKFQLPKVFHTWIGSFELVSLCCISGSSFVGSTKSLLSWRLCWCCSDCWWSSKLCCCCTWKIVCRAASFARMACASSRLSWKALCLCPLPVVLFCAGVRGGGSAVTRQMLVLPLLPPAVLLVLALAWP